MKRIYIFLVVIVFSTGFSKNVFTQESGIISGELMVMLNYKSDVNAIIDRTNKERPNASFKVKNNISRRINIWLISYDISGITDEDALKLISADNDVAIVQFNHNNLIQRNIPNDALWANQWDMLNDGINGNVQDADIDADSAWDISTGGLTVMGDTIVVAVIDGYFDLTHPDVDWWKNYAEIPGNSTDDDNNGYVDDYNGWSAFTLNDDIQSTAAWQSHGTHVSGTVGAIGNNNIGVAGVNWNVKVMPVAGSSTNEATVVAAYSYVLEQRARYNISNGTEGSFVVSTNSSFGVDYGQPSNYPLWCAFYDTLGAYGIISAGATINSNVDVDAQGDIPTACPSNFLISVTNTNSNDQKVSFAGYGSTTIDIGAPGDLIWSTVHGGGWEGSSWTGTSMATPHVAGAIGLLYSVACQEMFNDFAGDPAGMAGMMRDYLLNDGWDANTSLNGITVTGGRLNLRKCLIAVKGYANCFNGFEETNITSGFLIQSVVPNPVKNNAVLQYMLPYNSTIVIDFYDALGNKLFSKNCGDIFSGIHRQKLNFNTLSEGIYFLSLASDYGISNTIKILVY